MLAGTASDRGGPNAGLVLGTGAKFTSVTGAPSVGVMATVHKRLVTKQEVLHTVWGEVAVTDDSLVRRRD